MARYIDENKIKFTGLTFEDADKEVYVSLSDVRQAIAQTPTADVVEVKHGYWANEDFPEKMATMNDFAICSVCNNSSHKAEHGYSILSNYCPNCGADMRGAKMDSQL